MDPYHLEVDNTDQSDASKYFLQNTTRLRKAFETFHNLSMVIIMDCDYVEKMKSQLDKITNRRDVFLILIHRKGFVFNDISRYPFAKSLYKKQLELTITINSSHELLSYIQNFANLFPIHLKMVSLFRHIDNAYAKAIFEHFKQYQYKFIHFLGQSIYGLLGKALPIINDSCLGSAFLFMLSFDIKDYLERDKHITEFCNMLKTRSDSLDSSHKIANYDIDCTKNTHPKTQPKSSTPTSNPCIVVVVQCPHNDSKGSNISSSNIYTFKDGTSRSLECGNTFEDLKRKSGSSIAHKSSNDIFSCIAAAIGINVSSKTHYTGSERSRDSDYTRKSRSYSKDNRYSPYGKHHPLDRVSSRYNDTNSSTSSRRDTYNKRTDIESNEDTSSPEVLPKKSNTLMIEGSVSVLPKSHPTSQDKEIKKESDTKDIIYTYSEPGTDDEKEHNRQSDLLETPRHVKTVHDTSESIPIRSWIRPAKNFRRSKDVLDSKEDVLDLNLCVE